MGLNEDLAERYVGMPPDRVERLATKVAEQQAQIEGLAMKLRDVATALVEADGALFARIERLDTFVMDSAFGPDPSATQPAPPESVLEYAAPGSVQRGHFEDFGRGLEWVPESNWGIPERTRRLSLWQRFRAWLYTGPSFDEPRAP